MKVPILLHIPHSSIHIPSLEGYVVTQEQLQSELLKLTDWHTDDLVDAQLAEFGRCLIIDCHSFPEVPLTASFDKTSVRPDYNIGTDQFHTPSALGEASERHFKGLGHSVLIDKPYSGSIVPMMHYRKDKRVQSIMLEINRKLYLEEGSAHKSEGYEQVKSVVAGWVEVIRKEWLEN